MSTSTLFWLVVFQAKHYLADYPLQGPYMLGKFKPGWGFVAPLAAHASVHAAITLAISLVLAPSLWWLAFVDGAVHFVVDRVKASPQMLGRWTPQQRPFWMALGADQAAHHLTHYVILWALLGAQP
jgi:hypothetical protein